MDTLPGPSLASFVVQPAVHRRGTAYFEVTSGWLLHESGVFAARAERALMPVDCGQYRPVGDWAVAHQQAQGPEFRIKRGRFEPEEFTSGLDEAGVPPDLVGLWRSIPSRPRRLLGEGTRESVDRARWWFMDGRHLRMTLCYQRETAQGLRAVSQTRSIATPAGLGPPEEMARRIAQASWDVCVFSACLGKPKQVAEIGGPSRAIGSAEDRNG
jgi:hypothetical protein